MCSSSTQNVSWFMKHSCFMSDKSIYFQLTWPKSIVKLTSLNFIPRDNGGDLWRLSTLLSCLALKLDVWYSLPPFLWSINRIFDGMTFGVAVVALLSDKKRVLLIPAYQVGNCFFQFMLEPRVQQPQRTTNKRILENLFTEPVMKIFSRILIRFQSRPTHLSLNDMTLTRISLWRVEMIVVIVKQRVVLLIVSMWADEFAVEFGFGDINAARWWRCDLSTFCEIEVRRRQLRVCRWNCRQKKGWQ